MDLLVLAVRRRNDTDSRPWQTVRLEYILGGLHAVAGSQKIEQVSRGNITSGERLVSIIHGMIAWIFDMLGLRAILRIP